jgi:hypothetical protein
VLHISSSFADWLCPFPIHATVSSVYGIRCHPFLTVPLAYAACAWIVSYTNGRHFCRQTLYSRYKNLIHWSTNPRLYGARNCNFMLIIGPHILLIPVHTLTHYIICVINTMLGEAPDPSRMVLGPTQHHVLHKWFSSAAEFVIVLCKTCTVN